MLTALNNASGNAIANATYRLLKWECCQLRNRSLLDAHRLCFIQETVRACWKYFAIPLKTNN